MEYKWPIISYQIDRKCSSISRVEPLYWFKRESFNGSLHVLLQQTCSLKRCSKAEKLQLIRERKTSRTALTHSVTRQGRLGTKGFSWSRYETRWALNCLRKPFQVNKLVTHSSHWSMENLFEWFEVIDWNIFLFPFEAFKRKKNKGQSCRNAKRVGKLQVPSIGDSISPGTGWVMENGFESYFNWYVSWKVFLNKEIKLVNDMNLSCMVSTVDVDSWKQLHGISKFWFRLNIALRFVFAILLKKLKNNLNESDCLTQSSVEIFNLKTLWVSDEA